MIETKVEAQCLICYDQLGACRSLWNGGHSCPLGERRFRVPPRSVQTRIVLPPRRRSLLQRVRRFFG